MDAQIQSEARTLERFNRSQDRVARDFGYGDTVGALGIAKANLKKLQSTIELKIAEARSMATTTYKRQFTEVIRNLDSSVVALSALTTALDTIATGVTLI